MELDDRACRGSEAAVKVGSHVFSLRDGVQKFGLAGLITLHDGSPKLARARIDVGEELVSSGSFRDGVRNEESCSYSDGEEK
jgi:hypothetical protein